MKDFYPRKLRESLLAVREAHPDLGSALDGREDPKGTEAYKALRSKVLQADDLHTLLKSITTIERPILNWLLRDQSGQVRRIARQLAAISPTLFPTQRLWEALQIEPDDQVIAELIALLVPRNDLEPLQRLLIEEYDYFEFFQTLVNTKTSLATAFKEASVYSGHLRNSVLVTGVVMGELEVWALYEESDLVWEIESLSDEELYTTCENFYEENKYASGHDLVEHEPVRALLEYISYTILKDLPSAEQSWFKRLLILLELREFFSYDGNSERWDFWARYADQAQEIYCQHAERRLFIDFDTLGVIEFGEVGNAAYIYNIEDFRRLRRRAVLTTMHHADLKDRNRALRIIHSKNWQATTARVLKRYGVYRGTI